jgi:hypothetical protein
MWENQKDPIHLEPGAELSVTRSLIEGVALWPGDGKFLANPRLEGVGV